MSTSGNPLFDYMHDEHGLSLLESEMHEMRLICRSMDEREHEEWNRDLAAARERITALEAERDAWRAGLDVTTGSGETVTITPDEIPEPFNTAIADIEAGRVIPLDVALRLPPHVFAENAPFVDALKRISEHERDLDANHNVIRALQERIAALEAERDRLRTAYDCATDLLDDREPLPINVKLEKFAKARAVLAAQPEEKP